MRTAKFSPTHPTGSVSATTWEKLTTIGPAVIADILHARGFHQQVMRHDIQPLDRTVPLAGIARTMISRPLVGAPTPGREYELLFAAIDGLQPGEVLVTDEADCCVWGELCSEVAEHRGSNGIVIDGFTRDAAEIRKRGFPVYCRGRHMSDLLYHRIIVGVNEPVLCGDVGVRPGDMLVGSEDGVVVIPATLIDDVVAEAYAKANTETKLRQALRQGMSAGDAYRKYGTM